MKPKDVFVEIRKRNNLTQDDVAKRLYVTRQAVSRWEKGETIPNSETLKMISKEFGISIDEMLGSDRNKICQSCTYPMNDINEFGTNTDDTLNPDYCIYCYKGGTWVDPDLTIQGVIDHTIPFITSPSINEEQARIKLAALVPTLKRWK
ncbi:MAG: zinc ribbon domain-containing protein [Clostridia bacterium]